MSFIRPDVESLLGKVTSIGLTSGETEAEPVKILIIKFHYLFKLRVDGHIAITPSESESSGWHLFPQLEKKW